MFSERDKMTNAIAHSHVSRRYNVIAEVRRAGKRPAEILTLKIAMSVAISSVDIVTPDQQSGNRLPNPDQ